MKLSRNSKIFINYFLGPVLFIWLSWSIYNQIQRQVNLHQAWLAIVESFKSPLIWNLVAVLILMGINWSIEAFKWMLAVKPVQPISFITALKAILSGVSFSVSTPNRVGEYLGRVLYMKDGNRLKTISLTIVSSISQLIITLVAGAISLFVLDPSIRSSGIISNGWLQSLQYGSLIAIFIVLLFYFRLGWVTRWINKLPGSTRFNYLFSALEHFNATLLWQLLSLSLVRFLVFIVQYYLLFQLFGVNIGWFAVFWTISLSFLVMAAIPSIALVELVQRGKVITTITGLYSVNELGMTFTTASIWFINLVLPAIIGSLLILGIKKMYTNENKF